MRMCLLFHCDRFHCTLTVFRVYDTPRDGTVAIGIAGSRSRNATNTTRRVYAALLLKNNSLQVMALWRLEPRNLGRVKGRQLQEAP